jgi:surfactin synthase thioesterase subunit
VCHAVRANPRVRLVCFNYAGGNAHTYRRWHQLLPESIEVHAVNLPGRVPRLVEPPLASVAAVVEALTPRLAALKGDKPLVLFGHSFGAICAFETARALAKAGSPVAHLAVSARCAPHLMQRRRQIHGLADADFIGELRKMAGTPEEVLKDAELMELLLPALRADFTAIETYKPLGPERLQCTVSVFGGKDDPDVLLADLLPWQDHTDGMALVEMLAGGHFYIDADPTPMLATLARDLAHY